MSVKTLKERNMKKNISVVSDQLTLEQKKSFGFLQELCFSCIHSM